jgi:hypothetical protein
MVVVLPKIGGESGLYICSTNKPGGELRVTAIAFSAKSAARRTGQRYGAAPPSHDVTYAARVAALARPRR